MTEKICGTCKHYEPTRNPDTGRVLPSKHGACGFVVVWPVLPLAYSINAWGGDAWLPNKPRPGPIRQTTPADKCPCYSAKDRPKPKRQAAPQLGIETKEPK